MTIALRGTKIWLHRVQTSRSNRPEVPMSGCSHKKLVLRHFSVILRCALFGRSLGITEVQTWLT